MTALLFLSSFVFYLLGASGTVPAYRDSGDLVASIQTLGIAHPPGYAFYVLVGKLFVTLLPFGNVAYRVNVMSALFGAATVAVCYKLLSSGNNTKWIALAITLLLATAPAFIALARVPEMYTLSAFLAVSILCLLQSEHPHATSGAALLLGVGLSVHPTLVFLVPLFFVRPAKSIRVSTLSWFALGLCVFLYLPLRAMQDPLLNWGDPSQWRNFWRVVTRADYGGLKLHPVQSVFSWTPQTLWAQAAFFFKSLQAEMGILALVLTGTGVVASFRLSENKLWPSALLISWILSGPAFFLLSNLPLHEATTPAILQPYLLIPILLATPFIVRGLETVGGLFKKMPAASAIALVLMLSVKPWVWASQRHDFYAYDYARNLLRALPKDAVLYDPDDPTHFTIQVLKILEGRRPDVTLLSFFRTRWGYEQIKQRSPELLPPVPIQSAPELERIFWSYSALKRPFYAELPAKFSQRPYRVEGLVYAVQVTDQQKSTAESRRLARFGLENTVQRGDFVATHHSDFFTSHLIDYYASAHCNLGLEFASAKDWESAVAQYKRALEINPALSAAWNNLGIAFYERGFYPEAFAHFQRASTLEPNNEMLRKNAQLAGQKMPKNL